MIADPWKWVGNAVEVRVLGDRSYVRIMPSWTGYEWAHVVDDRIVASDYTEMRWTSKRQANRYIRNLTGPR